MGKSHAKHGDKNPPPAIGERTESGRPHILSMTPPFREQERKYIPAMTPNALRSITQRCGVDAESYPDHAAAALAIAEFKKRKLEAIFNAVRMNTDHFVTADHPDLMPMVPDEMRGWLRTPEERTRPRQRIYFVDRELQTVDRNIEIRQEQSRDGRVKQTIKTPVSRGAARDDATLERDEWVAKLTAMGAHIGAVKDKDMRKKMMRDFGDSEFIPAFRMVSQRLRLAYHPDGDNTTMIELACDVLLYGETMFGRAWFDPKLEIEIKRPKGLDPAGQRAILDREEGILTAMFNLVPQRESNAAIGAAHLRTSLTGAASRARFQTVDPAHQWWLTPSAR